MIIRRKVDGQAISIDQNSNIGYVSTQDDLSPVRQGSYLRLNGLSGFYVVQGKELIDIQFPFTVKAKNYIRVVNQNLIPQLQEGDFITLKFQEHELDIVSAIIEKGQGYKFGDIIEAVGGASINGETTSLIVKGIDSEGGIVKIGVNKRGKYSVPPNNENVLSGGSGKNAKFDLSFSTLTSSHIIETKISNITYFGNVSDIYLDTKIPDGLENGELSARKWSLTFTSSLSSQGVQAMAYSITKDFTPVLNLPLLAPNSSAVDVVYNQSMNVLEQEVTSLKKRIDYLEKRLAGLNIGV